MSKLVSFMMGGGLILAAIAVINFKSVDTRQQADFIQISVLAQSQANYGMDENLMSIPVVSLAILEDKVHDARENPDVPVILYTSLPVKEESSEDPEDEPQDPLVDIQHGNGHLHENNGNNGSNPHTGGNGNQGEGQENGNNGRNDGNNGKNDGNNGKNDDSNGKDKGKDKE